MPNNVPVENSAVLTVQNTAVQVGTPIARVPVIISSEFEGQTINGFNCTVQVQNVPLIDHKNVFNESIWNNHPQVLMLPQQLAGFETCNYMAVTWNEPWNAIKADGVVMLLTVDTSELSVGEYKIITNYGGYASATVTKDGSLWYPVRLEHKPGVLSVVPKRNNNLN